jgi:hypothetical protein
MVRLMKTKVDHPEKAHEPSPAGKRWAAGKRVDAHPNSLEAQAWENPELRKIIEEGRRRADQDLDSMNTWALKGCSPAIQSHPADFGDRLYV